MPAQQFVILSSDPAGRDGSLPPIGTRKDLLRALFDFNTGPESPGEDTLHGPGIRVELPPGQESVTQMLLTLTEEEVGWLVLLRLAKHFRWRILDPNTGRELNLAANSA